MLPLKKSTTLLQWLDFSVIVLNSAVLFVLLGLAASIMLATSAPTAQRMHVHRATTSEIQLNSGVCYS